MYYKTSLRKLILPGKLGTLICLNKESQFNCKIQLYLFQNSIEMFFLNVPDRIM